jgi:hypothetical protein
MRPFWRTCTPDDGATVPIPILLATASNSSHQRLKSGRRSGESELEHQHWIIPRLTSHPNSTLGLLMDLGDLKFWGAIAGMIAIAILAVIVLAVYERGCAPDVISRNLHMFRACE